MSGNPYLTIQTYDIVKYFDGMKSSAGSLEALFDQIDTNDDNVILRAEFGQFLKNNTPTGAEYSTDLLNACWDVFDINQSHSKIANTNFKNLNAVTMDEMKKMDVAVKEQEKVKGFLSNIQPPTNITNGEVKNAWLHEMSTEINNAFFDATNKGQTVDLEALYNKLFLEITPKYIVADMQAANSTALGKYGYNLDEDMNGGILDKSINNNLQKYMKQNPEASEEEIVDIIQKTVAQFAETADITAKFPAGVDPEEYNQGYAISPAVGTKFSELQESVINYGLENDEQSTAVLTQFPQNVQTTLLEGFYNNYYNATIGEDFGTIRDDAPQAFIDYVASLGGEFDVEDAKGVEETDDVEWFLDENSMKLMYLVEYDGTCHFSSPELEGVSITRNGEKYENITIKLTEQPSNVIFNSEGCAYFGSISNVTESTVITLSFIDNETGEEICSKNIIFVPETQEVSEPAVSELFVGTVTYSVQYMPSMQQGTSPLISQEYTFFIDESNNSELPMDSNLETNLKQRAILHCQKVVCLSGTILGLATFGYEKEGDLVV